MSNRESGNAHENPAIMRILRKNNPLRMVAAAVTRINAWTAPLERFVVRFRKPVSWGLLALAAASVALSAAPDALQLTGEQAWNALIVVLFLGPLARVTGLGVLRMACLFRKELGVLMGTLALVHFALFFGDKLYVSPLSQAFWWELGAPSYLVWGALALAATVPLWATSNVFSVRLLGKKWKWLHRSAYALLIFAALHVAFIKYEFTEAAVWVGVFAALKIAEWSGLRLGK